MRLIYTCCCLIFATALGAQTFTELPSISTLTTGETLTFADFDGDGDQDLFVTTSTASHLFTNDGTGRFAKLSCGDFQGASAAKVRAADLDGDGDVDILVHHYNETLKGATQLYFNDGAGNFTRQQVGFLREYCRSLDLADVDGDGDVDVLANYSYSSSGPDGRAVLLFRNDGRGAFAVDSLARTVISTKNYERAAFADLDGDGDPDVLLSDGGDFDYTGLVYLNDGKGGFAPARERPLGRATADVHLKPVDVDADGHVDLVGLTERGPYAFVWYRNDGLGNFDVGTSLARPNDYIDRYAFADFTGDGYPDLLEFLVVNGRTITRLFANDGRGGFSRELRPLFTEITPDVASFADVNGDGALDVVATSVPGYWDYSTVRLYLNDGRGGFAREPGLPFRGVGGGGKSIALADVDGDGYEDVLLSGGFDYPPGYFAYPKGIAQLYLNDAKGGYTHIERFPVIGGLQSSASFGDVNADGDVDLVFTAEDSPFKLALYSNDGRGVFKLTPTTLPGAAGASHKFVDIDGDGDLDVAISGVERPYETKDVGLFLNDGKGVFAQASQRPFKIADHGALDIADVDGDGDLDVLILGDNRDLRGVPQLYLNLGNGDFVRDAFVPFDDYGARMARFADVDGDGDADVLFNGPRESSMRLFLNDGRGGFRQNTLLALPPLLESATGFADLDGDGDLDLILAGIDEAGTRITRLYANDGIGGFDESLHQPFVGVDKGSIGFTDYDCDGDLDVIITGRSSACETVARLYRNDGKTSGVKPATAVTGAGFTLSPNPVTAGELTVRLDLTAEAGFAYRIIDKLGRELTSGVVSGDRQGSLSTAGLPAGVYILAVRTDGHWGHRSFVVAAH